MEVVGISRTAAAAIKSRKAVFAFILRIDVAEFKFIADGRIGHTCIYIAEKEFFLADKLVAWIEIAPWSNR